MAYRERLGYIKEKLEEEEFEDLKMFKKTNCDHLEGHHFRYVLGMD